jgi:hypothetical protein
MTCSSRYLDNSNANSVALTATSEKSVGTRIDFIKIK